MKTSLIVVLIIGMILMSGAVAVTDLYGSCIPGYTTPGTYDPETGISTPGFYTPAVYDLSGTFLPDVYVVGYMFDPVDTQGMYVPSFDFSKVYGFYTPESYIYGVYDPETGTMGIGEYVGGFYTPSGNGGYVPPVGCAPPGNVQHPMLMPVPEDRIIDAPGVTEASTLREYIDGNNVPEPYTPRRLGP